jgi:transcriptional regulatory protein LevR
MNVLEAIVNAVTAQAGNHVDAEHAVHMVLHVEMVIEALQG